MNKMKLSVAATALALSANMAFAAVKDNTNVGTFNMDSKTVELNSGYSMPIIGLGTFMLTPDEAEESVYYAIKTGFRLFDTANAYMNERAVGRGIRKAEKEGIAKREDIFVTTKLWISEYDRAEKAIDETLERLGTGYIDLLLLHQPAGNYKAAYKAMEKAVKSGKVKSIGLSNFWTKKYKEVYDFAEIKPAVLQVECNPFIQQDDLRKFVNQYGTVLESWYPLGGRGNTEKMFSNPTIAQIAKTHKKSPAQIVLRWHLQKSNIAIPGASDKNYIREDIELFDFTLSDEEMKKLSKLDTGKAKYDYNRDDAADRFLNWRPDFDSQK